MNDSAPGAVPDDQANALRPASEDTELWLAAASRGAQRETRDYPACRHQQAPVVAWHLCEEG